MTPPKNVNAFSNQNQIMNDKITKNANNVETNGEAPDEVILQIAKEIKDDTNLVKTDAGRLALTLADMEEDGEKAISKEKWVAFVQENFPHVTPRPIQTCIKVVDAMNSITTYTIREQTAKKAMEKSALEEKSQENGGDGKSPSMGV